MVKRALKSAVKATAIPVLDAIGWYGPQLKRLRACQSRWTILMYHRVIEDPTLDPFQLGMCVRREHFEQQMEFIGRDFHVLLVRDAVRLIARGEALPPGTVSITFDDGYRDNLEVALPIATRIGVPFTLFVPTGGVIEGEPLWWDRVICAVATTRRRTAMAPELGLPAELGELSLATGERALAAERILDALWELPPSEVAPAVDRVERHLAPLISASSFAPRLRPDQIASMHRRGIEIGAHSVSHPNMRMVTRAEAIDEMVDSRRLLESICGTAVEGFAYPGGRVSDGTVEAAQAAGFLYALATAHGINTAPYALHQLIRAGMPDGPMAEMRRTLARLAGAAEG
jgi:peptidoglycan/xylan/chitin deacetylase (PgdA/CDA1 family)